MRDDLDASTLVACCEALGRDADDVVELRDAGDLLIALVAKLILVQRGAPKPDAAAGDLLRMIFAGWGPSPFAAAQLLDWAETPLPSRGVALAGLHALVGGELTAQRVGRALGRLARRSAGAHVLLRDGTTDGASRWRVEPRGGD